MALTEYKNTKLQTVLTHKNIHNNMFLQFYFAHVQLNKD